MWPSLALGMMLKKIICPLPTTTSTICNYTHTLKHTRAFYFSCAYCLCRTSFFFCVTSENVQKKDQQGLVTETKTQAPTSWPSEAFCPQYGAKRPKIFFFIFTACGLSFSTTSVCLWYCVAWVCSCDLVVFLFLCDYIRSRNQASCLRGAFCPVLLYQTRL